MKEGDYLRGHHHSRSTPEISGLRRREKSEVPPVPSRVGPIPGPPTRTLRIQQPREIRRPGDVIVIGPQGDVPPSLPRRATPMNVSKPLPDIPREASDPATSTPNGSATTTPIAEIGVAVSGEHKSALDLSTSSSNYSTPTGPAHARAVLAKQHQRARTKRAFQTPTQGPTAYRPRSGHDSNPPSATSSVFPMHADIEPAIAMLDISTSSSTATSASASGQRRPTALEEAIGRSRAASVGNGSKEMGPKPIQRSRPRTAESDDPTLILVPHIQRPTTPPSSSTPTFCPSPPLAYPIRTDRAPSRPEIQHFDSTASKATVYADALEDFSDAESQGEMDAPPARRRDLVIEDSPQQTPVTGRSFDDGDFRVSPRTPFLVLSRADVSGTVLPNTA
jgi:hypothetical protein